MLTLIFATACSLIAISFAIWIVIPAPAYQFFEVAVAASEWSLWVGLLGLVGAGAGLLALVSGGRSAAWPALALGLGAFALSLVPPVSARRVAREEMAALSLRQYFLGTPRSQAVRVSRQILPYASPGGYSLDLDIYQPTDTPGGGARPAIVVVHGGSWSGGDKGDYPRWNEWLVEQGFVVFDIQYRLEQPNWQTATGDVKCAVEWVGQHAGEFGVDAGRLALLGRSAGGHLALLAAYATNQSELPPSCDAPEINVRAVVSLYGPTDLRWGYEHPANQRVLDGPAKIRDFLGGTPETVPERFTLLSPTTHVNAGSPPTLLVHGGRDQLVRDEHTGLLAQKLQAAGVPHRAVVLPYAQHAFDYNFDGWGSQIVRHRLLDFLRRHLA